MVAGKLGRPPIKRSPIETLKIKSFAAGLKRGSYLNDIPLDNFYVFNNVESIPAGGFRKRPGIVGYAATNKAWGGAGKAAEVIEYLGTNGTWYQVYRVNTVLYAFDGTTETTLYTFSTAPQQVSFSVFVGELIICPDNEPPLKWNGTTLIYLGYSTVGTATMTIATPAVVTRAAHGLVAGSRVYFTTTGALPTGVTASLRYYVLATGLTSSAFQFSLTDGGAAINTSGTQSGTHTLLKAAIPAGNWPYSATFRNRLFLCKQTNNRPQLRYSDPDDATVWSSVNEINLWSFGNPTGIVDAFDRLNIFTETEAWGLIGDPSAWSLRRVRAGGHYFLGQKYCQSPISTPFGVVVARANLLYLWDGNDYVPLGEKDGEWSPLAYYAVEAVASAGLTFSMAFQKNQLFLTYYHVSYPTTSRMLIYNFKSGVWSTATIEGVTGGLIGGLYASERTETLFCLAGTVTNMGLCYFSKVLTTHTASDTLTSGAAIKIVDDVETGFFRMGKEFLLKDILVDYTMYSSTDFTYSIDIYRNNDYSTVYKTITFTADGTSTNVRRRVRLRVNESCESFALRPKTTTDNSILINEIRIDIIPKDDRYTEA